MQTRVTHFALFGCILASACGSSHSADAGSDVSTADTRTVDSTTDTTPPSDTATDTAIDSTGCMPLRPGTVITGLWTQESRIMCGSGDVVSDLGIEELNLTESSRIEVTWTPFETYKDYWGTFVFADEGGMRIAITGGNYVPEDVDPEGCVFVDADDRLVLTNLYLGSPAGDAALACGHVFRRR